MFVVKNYGAYGVKCDCSHCCGHFIPFHSAATPPPEEWTWDDETIRCIRHARANNRPMPMVVPGNRFGRLMERKQLGVPYKRPMRIRLPQLLGA